MQGDRIRRGGRARPRKPSLTAIASAVFAAALAATASMEQLAERPLANALAHPAIGYYTRPLHDPVADLVRRVEAGEVHLAFDQTTGYLRSVLDTLRVPVE